MKLEETLNGGFGGLYGEVVTEDSYGLKKIPFIPDIFFDCGSNIGIVTRFVRELFPKCKIISIEPDKENIEIFKQFTHDDNVVLIEKAIGHGMIWKCEQDINGAHESYLSAGLGYPFIVGKKMKKIIETDIQSIMLPDIINEYLEEGMKSVCKIDIEGAENLIFDDEKSMEVLKNIDYISIELHWNALTGNLLGEVKDKTIKSLESFENTHICFRDNIYFSALKKEYANTI